MYDLTHRYHARDGVTTMNARKKLFSRNLELYLPFAALLIGMLLMFTSKPIVIQATTPVPMPQVIAGEYSYDKNNWYPLETATELSALDGDLYLRGHFQIPVYADSRLYFYCNHIAGEIFIDGELSNMDTLLEIEKAGIPLLPSLCTSAWSFWYFGEDVPTDALVEIHLKNPHAFGNKSAYRDFLSTLCCTPNDPSYLAKYLSGFGRPLLAAGIILITIGILLLGSAMSCMILRIPVKNIVAKIGFLSVFSGGFFLFDTIDVNFWSENNILNTYGWQICMMYSLYLLGIMAKDSMHKTRYKTASIALNISAVINCTIVLVSFSGLTVIYDTLQYWVYAQLLLCPILIICCITELIKKNTDTPVKLVLFILLFLCVMWDILVINNNLYSRRTLTKVTFVAFFLYIFVLSTKNILKEQNASVRAQKLEKELEESRISIMLSQIQPHFIFNVLGTLRGLCRENPEQAWRGLGDFSNYLRGNMNALTNAKFIPFETELRHVEAYLRLEQMRMCENLSIVYDIQEKNFMIPPLTIQPLVENAVKHGILNQTGGGIIMIHSKRENQKVTITVEDNGVGFDVQKPYGVFEKQDHIGLKNVQNRVENMLSGTLNIYSEPYRGTKVVLEFTVTDNSLKGV